jgi:hypothetical protein
MASLRDIKKDIDFLVNEVISDCYTFLYIHGDKDKEKVFQIIENVVEQRNEFITRANNPEKGADRKQVKSHYKQIYNDLLKAADDSFSKLSVLAN